MKPTLVALVMLAGMLSHDLSWGAGLPEDCVEDWKSLLAEFESKPGFAIHKELKSVIRIEMDEIREELKLDLVAWMSAGKRYGRVVRAPATETEPGKESVMADNGTYSFVINRDEGSSHDWRMDEFVAGGEVESTTAFRGQWNNAVRVAASVGPVSMLELIAIPGTVLANVSHDSEGFVTLVFHLDPDAGPLRPCKTLSVTVDPRHRHRVVRARAMPDPNAPRPITRSWETEYDTKTSYPLKHVEELTLRSEAHSLNVATFDWSYRGPSSSQLYLSYYDMPEPPGLRTSGSYRLPTWFYLVTGGILAIVAGFGILYLANRPRV